MIARIWKGVVRVDDADYIRETGFAEYAQTSGPRSSTRRTSATSSAASRR